MTKRKVPDGARVYQNDKFNIPPGWSAVEGSPGVFGRIMDDHRLIAHIRDTHDDWGWYVLDLNSTKLREGEASSRLAAMRKAELAERNLRRVA